MHMVRTVLLARFDVSRRKELAGMLPETQWKFIESLIGAEGSTINAALLSSLLDASLTVRHASIPELPVELALMKLLGQNSGDKL
jgi:hypothetical protein